MNQRYNCMYKKKKINGIKYWKEVWHIPLVKKKKKKILGRSLNFRSQALESVNLVTAIRA